MLNNKEMIEAMNTVLKMAADEILNEDSIHTTNRAIPECAKTMNQYICKMEGICQYYGVDITDLNSETNPHFTIAHNMAVAKVSNKLRNRVEMFTRLKLAAYIYSRAIADTVK